MSQKSFADQLAAQYDTGARSSITPQCNATRDGKRCHGDLRLLSRDSTGRHWWGPCRACGAAHAGRPGDGRMLQPGWWPVDDALLPHPMAPSSDPQAADAPPMRCHTQAEVSLLQDVASSIITARRPDLITAMSDTASGQRYRDAFYTYHDLVDALWREFTGEGPQ